MRISDWSSDVCSSDLHQPGGKIEQIILRRRKPAQPFGRKPPLGLGLAPPGARARTRRIDQHAIDPADEITECRELAPGDRKSVVEGKSGSVRVNIGGRSILQQKKKKSRNKIRI